MGTKVRIGDGQHTYKDTSYLVGDVSKSRLDELANELANETILYIGNTTGNVKYKGERGEKNSVVKVLDYTPRPIDLDTGIIEDVINVNNDKVTSNYQYLHVNKKLVPFETSLEEPVKLQTIFELYVDDELVVDITNAWLAGKDTTDPEFSPTPYTVSGPFENKSVLNTTGEKQVQYRYYTIQIKDDDGKIRDIIGATLPPIYYIYDNENTPNINYKTYGEFYFIDNFATLFNSYYLDSLPLYIRTVHFDGAKSTFKFSSTMPKIDTNPKMVEYVLNSDNICSKYPIGSTNGEDFGLTYSKLYNKNRDANFDDTKLKFNSYSDAKKFFSENIVATSELANLVNFSNSFNILNINIENLKIIKTSNNTFYIESPELPIKSPVYCVNYKSALRYAVIPNITKIEGYAGVVETHLYSYINDASYSRKTYINQELAKSYFGDYPYPDDKFKTPFSLSKYAFIYDKSGNFSINTHCFVVKNKTVNNSLFGYYCFVKIYYNDYIGGTLCRAQSNGNKTYFDLTFSVIDRNQENNKILIPDYIAIDGKHYNVNDNGVVYTDIDYNNFIENIESYVIEAFFTGKTNEPSGTNPLTSIYFNVDYFNNSLNKVTLSTYKVFSFLIENANENSIRSFKADITNVNITKADSTHPDLISYKDTSSDYMRLNLNEKKYIEEYNAQWDSYSAADRPKITIYFDSIECYYRIDKYVDNELVTNNNVMSIESDKLVLSAPFEIGKTLVSVTPKHTINELTQFVFDISTGTSDNPVLIELRYTTDDTSENAKIWPLQTVEDYTYGWLVNGETIVERQTNASAGNIVFALSGWNTNEGTSSAYNEQSIIEQQPWFEHYWALKASAKYHSIGKNGEKIEGCPTYFEFENAKSGDIIQIFYYNENNVEIAKSPIVNVI